MKCFNPSRFFMVLFLFLLAIPGQAAAIIVTNLNDSGLGSLRQAILDAGKQSGADLIEFQPGLSGTIKLGSVDV